MKIVEKENSYNIENIWSEDIYAGFSKPHIPGCLPEDFPIICSSMNAQRTIAFMKQVHSPYVHVIIQGGKYEGDGLFTTQKNIALIVKTADCLPLFFCSESLGVVGVVHMGWRSAKEGILEQIPYELKSFNVVAGVGMRRCCYQVGEEFLSYPRIATALLKRQDEYYFDPVVFARCSLVALGLPQENFYDLALCSKCDPKNFPSHRRTGLLSRTLSFIFAKQK